MFKNVSENLIFLSPYTMTWSSFHHLHKSRLSVVPYTSLDLLGPLAGGDVIKWVKLSITSSHELLRQSRWSGGTFSGPGTLLITL